MPPRNRGPAHAAELIDPEWQKQQLKDPSQSKTNFQKWARLMGDDTVGGWAKSKKAASKVAYGEDVLVKYYCARTAPPPRSSDPCASTANACRCGAQTTCDMLWRGTGTRTGSRPLTTATLSSVASVN